MHDKKDSVVALPPRLATREDNYAETYKTEKSNHP